MDRTLFAGRTVDDSRDYGILVSGTWQLALSFATSVAHIQMPIGRCFVLVLHVLTIQAQGAPSWHLVYAQLI